MAVPQEKQSLPFRRYYERCHRFVKYFCRQFLPMSSAAWSVAVGLVEGCLSTTTSPPKTTYCYRFVIETRLASARMARRPSLA
jgi:hypothetical protein